MRQATCDCGKNPDNRWYVYTEEARRGAGRTYVICPGCGQHGEVRARKGRASARAAAGAVEGAERGAAEGL